jgi:dihydrofolate reductase
MSLDGYIAGPGGEYDWIVMDPAIDFQALFDQFDTLVMGRKTFEAVAGYDDGGLMRSKQIVVFSRTLRSGDHPDVAITAEDPVQLVAALKASTGKDIWLFGGGELFQQLLRAGLVDTVEVGVMPILLGGGIPLLPPGNAPTRLRLTGTTPLASGILLLSYDVAPAAE